MTDRVIRVSLIAQASGYLQGMDAVRRKTSETATEVQKLADKRQGFEQVGQASIAFGVAAGAAATLAVARFMEFDAAMSQVKAATQETTSNMALLRAAALDAGASTVFTATEAANAIEELGKNGLSTQQILSGGLDSALALASAGNLELARAAEIAAITMKQFQLEGTDLPKVADLLAAGAGKAAGDVEDLAQALNQAALVAAQTGLSVEDTTGTLAAFADAGLLGSDAGTSFRSMLQRLTPLSGEAAGEMRRLGINAFDAAGEFIGIEQFAGVLQDRLSGLTDEQRAFALAQIFGSDAVRAANVLYQQGAEGIGQYIAQTDDAGYAAQVAADRLDNLKGDLEALGGAFDTALIQSGSGANEMLRSLVQTATFLVGAIGEISPEVLGAGTVFTGLAGTIALVAGAALVGVPRVAAFRDGLTSLGISGGAAARGIALASGGLAILTVGLTLVATEAAQSQARIKAYSDTLLEGTQRVTAATREMTQENLAAKKSYFGIEQESAYEAAEKLGISLETVTDAASGQSAALEKLSETLKLSNTSYAEQREAAEAAGIDMLEYSRLSGLVATAVKGESESLDAAKEAARQKAEVTEIATEADIEHADALAGLQGAAVATNDDIQALSDTIRGFGQATLDTRAAQREFQAALDELSASVEANGATLDIGTAAGRANQQALDDIANSTKELSSATLEQTGSQELAAAAIAEGRAQLILALAQFGITGAAAEAYADELGLIPANVRTAVELNTEGASQKLDTFIVTASGRRIRIAVDTYGGQKYQVRAPDGSGTDVFYNANGGIYGYGGGRHQVQSFASGGFPTGIYSGGTPMYKFAEPETGWEAFISGRPGQEARNRSIAEESLRRLGGHAPAPAGGGAGAGAAVLSMPDGMRLEGTLDLGNGLEGRMRAVVVGYDQSNAAAAARGRRRGS